MKEATHEEGKNALFQRSDPCYLLLRLKNQQLIHKSLNLGLFDEAYRLRRIDEILVRMLHKSQHFDFVSGIAHGRTLLVGEGNFSFSLSLVKNPRITANRMIASAYENKYEISDDATKNAETLKMLGATVLFNVDATALRASLGSWLFDTIIFQFPHTGSREPLEGHNPNFILVRDFLKSAADQLRPGGQVLINSS